MHVWDVSMTYDLSPVMHAVSVKHRAIVAGQQLYTNRALTG